MRNIAVIDIGSNSIRLAICRTFSNNSFKIIDEEKQMVRLCLYIDSNRNLSEDGLIKTINTLEFFKVICNNNNVEKIIVVATEAIRSATNSEYILNKIKRKTGLVVRVLNGNEEAYYGYLAIKYSIEIDNAFLVDIGGASMEISLIKNHNLISSISLPLGAVPLTKLFPFNTPATIKQKYEFKQFLLKYFDDFPWLKTEYNIPVIGIGGTTRTIGKIHRKSINYPLDITHNYTLSLSNITNIYENISNLNVKQKSRIKGLPKERVDIITAPIGALSVLMEYCNCSELKLSQYGIREGILYNSILESTQDIDILDWSIKSILTNENININHSTTIWNISKKLYDLLEINSNSYKLLKTVSHLHDIGINISFNHNYKHSFYIILNSNLVGLDHKELLMVSYTIALSWKSDFKLKQKYKELLSQDNIILCKKLSTILTLSYTLDRCYSLSIDIFSFECNDSHLIINLPKENIKVILDAIIDNLGSNFEKYFNKQLSIK